MIIELNFHSLKKLLMIALALHLSMTKLMMASNGFSIIGHFDGHGDVPE
jgi:hypothetical protein